MRIAIPCNFPGGLESQISNHFGECDIFTVIEIDTEKPSFQNLKLILIENKDHLNCGIPILRLKKVGTNVIIIHKIGKRPFEILQKEKIPLFAGKGTVLQVLKDFCDNRLPKISKDNICPQKKAISKTPTL